MAFQFGTNAKVYLGAYDITTYFRRFGISRTKQLLETTSFGDTARDFIEGLKTGTISLDGLFEPTNDTQDEQLNAIFTSTTVTTPISLAPGNDTLGNLAYVAIPLDIEYSIDTPFEDLISVSAQMQASTEILRGHSLHALGAETTTGNGTGVNNGAASSLGGRLNHHVTAFSGSSGTLSLEDSADDISYAAVTGGSYGPITAADSTTINITGAIRQYSRIARTGTFTSITFASALGRRN